MKEIDWANLSFGYMKTDYNVRINFRNGAWGELEISSSEVLNLHMAATCLHYGQEAFEGLKAFRGKDGKVRIFRLEENAARLQSTCQGIMMAELPTERFNHAGGGGGAVICGGGFQAYAGIGLDKPADTPYNVLTATTKATARKGTSSSACTCKESLCPVKRGEERRCEYIPEQPSQRPSGVSRHGRVRPLQRRSVMALHEAAFREGAAKLRWYSDDTSPSVCGQGAFSFPPAPDHIPHKGERKEQLWEFMKNWWPVA